MLSQRESATILPEAGVRKTPLHVLSSMSAQPATSLIPVRHAPDSKLPTPIRINRLAHYLRDYDPQLAIKIFHGFTSGFRIPSKVEPHNHVICNHSSALANMNFVDKHLSKEVAAGRVSGPHSTPPLDALIISPLGLVPKKAEGEWRLIHDLSYPHGESVNAGIDKSHTTVSYEVLDHVVEIVQSLGKGCFIAKSDLLSAFRILPIHPSDYKFLGMKWRNKYYYDKCLPMGASTSCADFESVATFLQWALVNILGVKHASHILDDFMLLSDSRVQCAKYLRKFEFLCKDLNLPIKHSKTVQPSTNVQLHGLEVDTLEFCIRLPKDKLDPLVQLLKETQYRRKVTLLHMQSLVGSLSFACRAIQPGRPFLRRLIDLTVGVKHKSHHIRMTIEARRDIKAWLLFLNNFNGVTMMIPPSWTSSDSLRLYSDASGLGYAAVFGHKWFYGIWPSSWHNYNIAVKELFPIINAVRIWGKDMANKRILLTDNESISFCIKKQSAKDPHIMHFIRELVVTSLKYNFIFSAKHIPGKYNKVSDLLSRLCISQALAVAPWLEKDATTIPAAYLP